MVGNYRATFYNVNGINLETRKRREHLSDADLQKNKQLLESFTKGNMEQGGKSIKVYTQYVLCGTGYVGRYQNSGLSNGTLDINFLR